MQSTRVHALSILAGLAVLLSATANAATIRIEQDGSGDSTSITFGMLAAAPGDTILIGPGWYQQSVPFTTGGSTEETFAAVSVDSLTIIGEDRDSVIIGPEAPEFTTQGPRGVVFLQDVVTFARLESVTIVNVGSAVFSSCSLLAKNISMSGCRRGFFVTFGSGVEIEDLSTVDVRQPIIGGLSQSDVVVRNSEFRSCAGYGSVGFSTNVSNVVVENSRFIDCGLQFALSSSGVAHSLSFEGPTSYVQLDDFSELDMVGCTFDVSPINLAVNGSSHISGTNNLFRGGSVSTLQFTGSSTSALSNSHIFRVDGSPVVLAEAYRRTPVQVDLRGNWWGTTSADSLRAWIVDGEDLTNPPFFEELAEVLFEPFATGPVPSKVESMGSLKARFRH